MEKLVLDETGGVPSQHPLEVGILLEKNNCAIAGAFLNLSLIPTGLLILTMFVNEEYRRKGIHTKLHDLIDQIGMFHNKKTVFSNFHASNRIMVEFVSKKQNYEPFVYVVKRPVKK
jgi:hypothetical protein